jgi:hypothetical protein
VLRGMPDGGRTGWLAGGRTGGLAGCPAGRPAGRLAGRITGGRTAGAAGRGIWRTGAGCLGMIFTGGAAGRTTGRGRFKICCARVFVASRLTIRACERTGLETRLRKVGAEPPPRICGRAGAAPGRPRGRIGLPGIGPPYYLNVQITHVSSVRLDKAAAWWHSRAH